MKAVNAVAALFTPLNRLARGTLLGVSRTAVHSAVLTR